MMLDKYRDFISESIFSFLKRDKYNYNKIYDLLINNAREYLRQHGFGLGDDDSIEYDIAIKKSAVEYMNENLVDKTIKLDKAITGKHVGDKNIEIVFKRCELTPNPSASFRAKKGTELIAIYDKDDKKYIVNIMTVFAIEIKRKINRQITSVDPLGEEDWDE